MLHPVENLCMEDKELFIMGNKTTAADARSDAISSHSTDLIPTKYSKIFQFQYQND